MISAYSSTKGFDLVLRSRVVFVIQIVTICQLRALNSYYMDHILNQTRDLSRTDHCPIIEIKIYFLEPAIVNHGIP